MEVTPDWDHAGNSLACMIHGKRELFLMFHAAGEDGRFVVPAAPKGKRWHGAVDTSRPAPDDICLEGHEKPIEHQESYTLPGRSMAILVAR